jgi:hypothetical protein
MDMHENQSPSGVNRCIYIDLEAQSRDSDSLANLLTRIIDSKPTRSHFLYKNSDEKAFLKWSRKKYSIKRKDSQN